jgi:ribosomal protein S24E
MKIQSEFGNDLLKRKEIVVNKAYDSNPGFETVTKEIAAKFKVNEDVIAIRKIGSSFGTDSYLMKAFIYDSVKDKERIEPKKKEKKKE